MRVELFGNLTLITQGREKVDVRGSKTLGLIAYLAMNMDMPPSRDRIMTLFWGDRFTDQARQSLRQAISKLRRLGEEYGEDIVTSNEERIGLNPKTVQVDVDDFFRLAKEKDASSAVAALGIMKGPLLDSLFGQQAEFDDWLASERQRVATTAGQLFEKAADHQMQEGDLVSALQTARKLISFDPLRDGSQKLLIRILAQSGERAAAIQQFNSYEETLQKELGVGAGPDLQRLMQEIKSEKFSSGAHGQSKSEPARSAVPPPTVAATPPASSRPRVVVVPISVVAAGEDVKFFSVTATQDIVMNLSRFKWLDVHAGIEIDGARLTSDMLKSLYLDHEINFAVHGFLRLLGTKKMRLTVQLAEPKSGRFLWVQRFERESEDIFELQDELADAVASAIEDEIERVVGRASESVPFEHMTAWDSYHRGLAIQYEFSGETNLDAQKHFRRAIALDPNFAAAYARLSYAMVISAIYFGVDNVDDLLGEALDLAQTASRLEPNDAVTRFALGRVYLARGEYDRSLAQLGSAIDLNPLMAQAHCGLGDSLAYSGDLDGAMACFEEAVRISPTDPYRWAFLNYGATALLFKRDFEGALDWATRAEAVPNSHCWTTAVRTSALGHMGREKETAQALKELLANQPDLTCDYVRERLFYLKDPEQIDIYIEGLKKAGLT